MRQGVLVHHFLLICPSKFSYLKTSSATQLISFIIWQCIWLVNLHLHHNSPLPQGRALTARSLAARVGETDRIHFLCGTQSLQHENQVSLVHERRVGDIGNELRTPPFRPPFSGLTGQTLAMIVSFPDYLLGESRVWVLDYPRESVASESISLSSHITPHTHLIHKGTLARLQ